MTGISLFTKEINDDIFSLFTSFIRNISSININSEVAKIPNWINHSFGIGGILAYKNLQRNKLKHQITIVSIFVCVTSFIALAGFVNTGFLIVDNKTALLKHNVTVGYDGNLDIFATLNEIRNIDSVEEVIGVGSNYLQINTTPAYYTSEYLEQYPNAGTPAWNEERIDLIVIDEVSFNAFAEQLNLDYAQIKKQGILIPTVYLDSSDNSSMATIFNTEMCNHFEGTIGTEPEKNLRISIAKITDIVPFNKEFLNSNAQIILGADSYKYLIENPQTHTLFIHSKDASQTEKALTQLLVEYNNDANWFYIENKTEALKELHSFYLMISIFLYGFISVIAIIEIANIANTVITNLNLRRREFAILKSIGMTKYDFHRMMTVECFFYGILSLITAIPTGLALSYAIFLSITKSDSLSSITYQVPFEAIVSSTIMVLFLLFICTKYSLKKINQQNVIETIRNENF